MKSITAFNPWINFNCNTIEAFEIYKSVFGGEFTKLVRFQDISSPLGYGSMIIANEVRLLNFTMPKIYIMCGLPFSGKSTLSKEISDYLAIPRISFDEEWQEEEKKNGKIPGVDGIEQWKFVSQLCEQKVSESLKRGISVIYDNLGDNSTNRNHIKDLAQQNQSEAIIIYLDISKEEVIRRRELNLKSQERNQVSDENFDRAISSFEPPTETENIIKYTPNQDIKLWLQNEFSQVLQS
jgi:adenylate kinase family enzyme